MHPGWLRFAMGVAFAGMVGVLACASAETGASGDDKEQSHGRLRARPTAFKSGAPATLTAGEQPLGLGDQRDGLVYVPRDLPKGPVPLLLLLHGARGGARGVTNRVGVYALADEFKAVVVAPDARDGTWDVIHGGFGPDVAFLDRALDHIFSRIAIDPTRVGVAGFSDGASYALSLGLSNGDLFTHVIAFSPGFMVVQRSQGRPAIFVSHGTADEILPFGNSRDGLVPRLRGAGYTVEFRVFAGPHTVPADVAHEAFVWMLGAAPHERIALR